jgi:hypothetical protein
MTAYIKLSTGEYPRHPGDIEVDPVKDYAAVEWADPPQFDVRTQRCAETSPALVNGAWKMVWSVRDATLEEVAFYDEMVKDRSSLKK